MRADARRNRDRIVTAAREVLAEAGIDAPMDDVARQAGVGVGTLYRHFPTKSALLGEMVRERFAQFLENVQWGLQQEDPWEGFAGTLRRNAEIMAADVCVQDAMSGVPACLAASDAEREQLLAVGAELVRRAQEAGALRDDFSVHDIPMVMCGVTRTMARDAPWASDWRRFLEFVLAGLRADRRLPPPGAGPAA
jgi:AcrR family transcriptional regulator